MVHFGGGHRCFLYGNSSGAFGERVPWLKLNSPSDTDRAKTVPTRAQFGFGRRAFEGNLENYGKNGEIILGVVADSRRSCNLGLSYQRSQKLEPSWECRFAGCLGDIE